MSIQLYKLETITVKMFKPKDGETYSYSCKIRRFGWTDADSARIGPDWICGFDAKLLGLVSGDQIREDDSVNSNSGNCNHIRA